MKKLFLLALSLSSLSVFAHAPQHELAIAKYQWAHDASVQAAARFLSDVRGDFDYESIDEMTAWVRRSKGLKAWDRPDFLDSMNIAIVDVTQASMARFTVGRPWGLEKIQHFLINEGLPEYFKANPKMAAECYWNE